MKLISLGNVMINLMKAILGKTGEILVKSLPVQDLDLVIVMVVPGVIINVDLLQNLGNPSNMIERNNQNLMSPAKL